MKVRSMFCRLFWALLLVCLGSSSVGAQVDSGRVSTKRKADAAAATLGYPQLETLAQVLHFVDTNYLYAKSEKRFVEFAIRGLVDRLDKHSRYYSKEELAREEAKERKRALGIGIEWELHKQRCVVLSVRPGSAADRAGVKPGEEIFSFNGLSPTALGRSVVEKFLTDRSGKWTRLGLQGIALQPRTVRVPPPEIEFVQLERRPNKIVILRLGRIFVGAQDAVTKALDELDFVPKGLVLDIRGNTGGVVEEAVRISDLWLSEGRISVMVDASGQRKESVARSGNEPPRYPIAVLIDGRTASAAEVLAAALAQNGRAKLVGTQSFGKATVQTLIRMTDGSALKLTVGRLLMPDGESLDGLGLVPNLEVLPGRTPDGRDRQLLQAMQAVLYPR
jgi:carboxyl-terminal processing protease